MEKMEEEAMFYNADMQYELEQAMREEMEPPIDHTYEQFIADYPDGKYTIYSANNDSDENQSTHF